jgi:alanine racemase
MTVFRYDSIEEIDNTAAKIGKKAKVHIKVDTGMGRIGILPDESGLEYVKAIMSKKNIEIEGIFTHFARADEIDKTSAHKQLDLFKGFVKDIKDSLGLDIPVKHCSNSAGIIELPEANMDMVRAGITLYGLYPSDEVSKEIVPLKPALSLYSHIVYVKTVHKGDSISYGGTFTASKDVRVATVPLGYADGYPRSLSGKGYVLIRGRKAPILGRVCMDQFMVDVTDIPDVKEDDIVTLIGYDGGQHISAEALGDLSGRFNYELVCDLNVRLPRVYIYNGKYDSAKIYTD